VALRKPEGDDRSILLRTAFPGTTPRPRYKASITSILDSGKFPPRIFLDARRTNMLRLKLQAAVSPNFGLGGQHGLLQVVSAAARAFANFGKPSSAGGVLLFFLLTNTSFVV